MCQEGGKPEGQGVQAWQPREAQERKSKTNRLGLAKRCLLGEGLIVPVEEADEAEEAEEESSSGN